MNTAKPFSISKKIVWEAYKRVKANKGAAGVDEESIAEFEKNLKDNLYKLWNRMSSGCYFPPPVRIVEIPKGDGKMRKLGIPTVSDRIAQMVVKLYLEPEVDPHFHPDSFGYRPGKSAIEAVGKARERCWRYNYVVDLDIKGFFDNLDHELVMRAVRKHTDSKWILMYIERWLKAPAQNAEGTLISRDRGTPQGGVISPLLANLFLHYAFDDWMRRNYPNNPFERYADDGVVHCKTEAEANQLKTAIAERLRKCKLELHPEKTKIVYCKDDDRRKRYLHEKFDFLGYTFRARRSKNRRGKYFVNFSPAVSNKAKKKMSSTMRGWKMHLRSDKTIGDLSRMFNPIMRGWINYYGKFYKSELYSTFSRVNRTLSRWATRKYKKLRGHSRRAMHWMGKIAKREPKLFAHWQLGVLPAAE
jgi:RNA-directed DNA polymerase